MDERKQMTLCLVCQDGKVLLGMKKRGFGAGRWNGFGGKVQEGETVEKAACREIEEEAGVVPDTIEEMGTLDFMFRNKPGVILEVHVFRAEAFTGEPRESEEMRPQWFSENELPFDEMWSDDIHWVPLFLRRKQFYGRFLFDESDLVLEMEVKEI